MSNSFYNTIFKDIFQREIKDNPSEENMIATLKNINYLYKNVYKNIEIKKLDEAVIDFGDYVYSTMPNFSHIFHQFKILERYFYLVKKEEENFTLVLETLNKKEKNEVYSLLDAIKRIPENKSIDFMLDNQPREITIPHLEEDCEEANLLYRIVASYITLILRKQQCIISIVVHQEKYDIIIGVLISNGQWLPLKKDYMKALHAQTLKKMGEKISPNIKYGEIKKNLKFS